MKHWKVILFFVPWLLLLLALLLWSMGLDPWKNSGRTEVINTTIILQKVEDLGRLELVRYNYSEVFDYKALSEGKISAAITLGYYDFSPDLKVILITRGEAVGCIDLRKIREQDLRENNDTLYIQLPQPEICYYKLDMEHTRIYDFERKGWWSRLFSDDEEMKGVIENAYKMAEKQILDNAMKSDIFDKTLSNAEIILKPILEEISKKKIIFLQQPLLQKIAPVEN